MTKEIRLLLCATGKGYKRQVHWTILSDGRSICKRDVSSDGFAGKLARDMRRHLPSDDRHTLHNGKRLLFDGKLHEQHDYVPIRALIKFYDIFHRTKR
jgi:hypothetical protein